MRDRLPFSHLLPLIDLALLVILVFVPITFTALHLYQASNGSDPVHIHSGEIDMTFPRGQIIPWAIRASTIGTAQTIKSINLPGAIFDILISLPTSWPSMWHPQALSDDTWAALVYPFYCLPFWWLVGCGLDGIVKKERGHWSFLLLGTILCLACLVCAFSFQFGLSREDRADSRGLLVAALAWTIGFATLPTAWILQAVRGRRTIHNEGAPS